MNSSAEIKNNHFLVIKEHPRNPNKHILPVFQHYYNNPQFSNNPFLNLQSVTLTVYLTYSYSQAYHRFILPSRVVGPNRMSLNDILDAINTYDHISLDKQSISYKVNNENLLIKGKGSALVENLADRCCSKCENRSSCWEREFNQTFNSFQGLIQSYEDGKIELPKDLERKCVKNFNPGTDILYFKNKKYISCFSHNVLKISAIFSLAILCRETKYIFFFIKFTYL